MNYDSYISSHLADKVFLAIDLFLHKMVGVQPSKQHLMNDEYHIPPASVLVDSTEDLDP